MTNSSNMPKSENFSKKRNCGKIRSSEAAGSAARVLKWEMFQGPFFQVMFLSSQKGSWVPGKVLVGGKLSVKVVA